MSLFSKLKSDFGYIYYPIVDVIEMIDIIVFILPKILDVKILVNFFNYYY